MMETSILNQLPFDPGFLILGLVGLVLILLILLISAMMQLKSLSRKYDYFMRGKDAETLEDVIMDQIEEIRNLKAEDRAAKEILDKKLSVRETERLVKRLQKEASGEKKEEKKKNETLALIYQDLEDRMKSVMGTKVSIHNKDKNKGRIEIEYYSEAELERIVEMIESIG